MRIRNPILPGFHPDPSICRVGGDYYIATSTFEWFPGVRIHHSRDLANWRCIGHALDRVSQLDMRGCQNSAGVWAPCLTHADGLFWLVYTNVRHHAPGVVMDTPNFLVTSASIEGPWSEPVFLNASGFDPSLFHDDDGRKYIVQMRMGEAVAGPRFDGIILQGFDPATGSLTGPSRKIWEGSAIGITEGPHLLKRDGWYYLITAEGGTSKRHAVSVCRSRDLWGPYEIHPDNPILTSYQKECPPFQSAGHACFVETPAGDWFAVHLCQRPLRRPDADGEPKESVPLGRETAIQALRWDCDGWPRLAEAGNSPAEVIHCTLPAHPWPERQDRDGFARGVWGPDFVTLREPRDESWCSLDRRPGWLSLRGRDSLASTFDQSLVARRLCSFRARAETTMQFRPDNFKQSAGLIAYYDRFHYHYLRLTSASPGRVKLGVISSENQRVEHTPFGEFTEDAAAELHLRMEMDHESLRFWVSIDGSSWHTMDRVFDATALGDWVSPYSNFTGTFWGVCCQDLCSRTAWAEFSHFTLQTLP